MEALKRHIIIRTIPGTVIRPTETYPAPTIELVPDSGPPAWVLAGADGFASLLRDYGLSSLRQMPPTYPNVPLVLRRKPVKDTPEQEHFEFVSIDEKMAYTYSVMREPAAEVDALDNLEKEARRWINANGRATLTLEDRQLIALDRYYLTHYERREFKLRYLAFSKRYLEGNDPAETHNYLWIADRMVWDTERGGKPYPDERRVIDALEVASARYEMALDTGGDADADIRIGELLKPRTYYAAPVMA